MENPDPQTKDSYDQFLAFSQITEDNWLLPDRKNYMPRGISREEWLAPFLRPRLTGSVPRDVIRVFEVARGAMIYSWFFYPLATLGLEQCTRVGEFAISERRRLLSQETEDFYRNIKALVICGLISNEDEPRWQALRQLRNDRSHLNNFMLTDPGQAIGFLETTAELINKIFKGLKRH